MSGDRQAGAIMVAAGIGLRPRCGVDELLALLRDAAARGGVAPTVLAAHWFRHTETVTAVARHLGLPLAIIAEPALRAVQPACPTRSKVALSAHGIASVAEGCALAQAGNGARLLLPRINSANGTCAIATAPVVGECPP